MSHVARHTRAGAALFLAGWAIGSCATPPSGTAAGSADRAAPTPYVAAPQAPPVAPDGIDTDAVFGTLKPPTAEQNAPYHFKEMRVPARPNETALPFPPAAELNPPKPPAVPTGPLEVSRHQPDGPQEIVGSVSATFNQPMVPLASLEDLKAQPVPLQVEPLPPGRFRWVGTSTVEFQPEGRMPFATKYTARIPASAQASAGRSLGHPVEWSFETPRPVVTFSPQNGFGEAVPNQLLQLTFNQAVKANAVRRALTCKAADRPLELIESKPETDPFKDNTEADVEVQRKLFFERNVFLRPAKPLPLDAAITCTLPAGFQGAEGPLPTTAAQSVSFRTYAPLRIDAFRCGWGDQCQAEGGIQIQFNNALEIDQELADVIKVEPPVADLRIESGGPYAMLQGGFQPSTEYKVRVLAAIRDVHKQTLGHEEKSTIKFEKSPPQLELGGTPHAILESVGPRVIPVYSTNVREAQARWYRIEPKDIRTSIALAERVQWDSSDPLSKLTPIATKTIKLGDADNRSQGFGLSVDPILGAGNPGLLLVDLEAKDLPYERRHRAVVVQVTDLGITAHLTDETAVVLVTSLATGRPVAGVRASLRDTMGAEYSSGETDTHGLAELKGPAGYAGRTLSLLASKGSDRAVLNIDQFKTGDYISSYQSGTVHDHLPTAVASVFTDRQPYRPGETVHVAGVVRVATHGVKGTIEPLPNGAQLNYQVTDSRGGKSHKGTIAIGALGMFSVDLKLAEDASLGSFHFQGTLGKAGTLSGQQVGTSFEVQEYRTPEYRVSVESGEDPHFTGETLHGKVRGEYYFGGAMSGATANWNVSRSKGSFSPPGNTGFTFGDVVEPQPWMGWRGRGGYRPNTSVVAQGTGAIDANGTLPFDVALNPGDIKGPTSFQIEASVVDANRQSISASSTVLAHAGAWYPGLKIDRGVVKEGESVVVSAITADIDGKRHDPPTAVELAERKWERVKKNGAWSYEQKETPVEGCKPDWNRKLDDPTSCRLKIPTAGNFVIRVHAKDDHGRENVSATMVWAFGKGWRPWFQNENATVELVADKPEHAPGETAQILIRSPFPKSVGILAIQREGLIEYRALDFEGSAHGVGITLTEAEVPNVTLTVSLVRGRLPPGEVGALEDDPDDAGRPMYAGGSIVLPISKQSHVLKVAVTPVKATIEPGSKLGLQIKTTTAEGKPHAARLAVAVVDEGVLSLLGYSIPNPLEQIFAQRPGEGGDVSAVPLVLQRDAKLKQMALQVLGEERPRAMRSKAYRGEEEKSAYSARVMMMAAPAAAGDVTVDGLSGGGAAPTMTARTFFASTAYFNADVTTDAQGSASLTIPMPENLTRYRIMVVAVGDDERFGSGDGSVQVRKPLLVRPSLPRFLNLGDKFLASAVLNNQTETDLWVEAQARAANSTVDVKRQRVLVRAGQATEVAFEATAGMPGNSRWQFAAVALSPERWNDAAELDLPIKLPATVEAFATYGVTDKSVLQPVQLPKDALPDFGGLEVSMSSTALTGLSDAVAYLHDYPYECVEQTASRILPIIVLRKIIGDFHMKGAGTDEERDKLIKEGLEKIWAKQRDDGGFGYWSDSHDSYLYVSAWASYVITRAQKAGYGAGDYRMERLKSFLEQRLAHPRHDFGEDRDFNSQAMATLVLAMQGAPAPAHVSRIFDQRKELALFGKAWLMEAAFLSLGKDSAEVKQLNTDLQSAAVQKPSSAHFAESTTESIRLIMHSNERTDAIVLAAFLHVRPEDPLIPKIIHGLNETRTRGRWDTTQSNAWGTVAVSDYYEAFEKETPHFDANIFVGNGFVGQGKFAGRETKTLTENVPFSAMAGQANSDLTLEKVGTGRLYYRLGLRYAPKDLKLAPEEQGFAVTRTYLEMPDSPGSVTKGKDGTIHIKAGADVRVQIQVVVSDRGEFLAVDDPLPAGLEAVNTAFLTSQSSRVQEAQGTDVLHGGGWWSWWSPFNHTEMKDDRVALFADHIQAGVYTHTYVARATTKGTFQVPPARAFEMYEPENFGRTGSIVVTVE